MKRLNNACKVALLDENDVITDVLELKNNKVDYGFMLGIVAKVEDKENAKTVELVGNISPRDKLNLIGSLMETTSNEMSIPVAKLGAIVCAAVMARQIENDPDKLRDLFKDLGI